MLTLAQREVRSGWFIWWRGSVQTVITDVRGHLTRDCRRKGVCMEDVGLDFLLKILTSMSEVIGGSPSVCGAQGCLRALPSVCPVMVPQRC